MGDGERPGGSGRDAGAAGMGRGGRAGRLRLYRGGRARRTRPGVPLTPGEVADRLSALERRVEKALRGSAPNEEAGLDLLRVGMDGTLGVLAGMRRWSAREALAALRQLDWERLLYEPGRRAAPLASAVLQVLYRQWWRVEVVGLEHVPRHGRVVLVANRSGAPLPYEALMIAAALENAPLARPGARPLVDPWLARLPAIGAVLGALGAVPASAAAARRLLERDEAVILLPEDGSTSPKLFRSRYRLAPLGDTFARAAIRTSAPIVPVAVIGAEEAHPVLARLETPARLLGLPVLPLTPTFPWLGVAGLLPLPTKWTLHFGEPLDVAADHSPADAGHAATVRRLRGRVRERLQALVLESLRQRRFVFFSS
jgi:1-acyl-sn-glycerol-3-phosphate acyltransferase